MGGLTTDGGAGLAGLTAEQVAAATTSARHVRVTGGAGTGKTRVIEARHGHLAATVPAGRLLVLCRDGEAAAHLRDRLAGALAGGYDGLPVTTVGGVAHDLATRAGRRPRVLGPSGQRALVRRLLAADGPGDWPTCGRHLGRRAFADAVAAEVSEARRLGEVPGHWPAELAAFLDRYQAALAGAGLTDHPGLLADAADLARSAAGRWEHVLVDDLDALPPVGARLVASLAAGGAGLTVTAGGHGPAGPGGGDGKGDPGLAGAVDEHRLTRGFRHPDPPHLVLCAHPALEAEAVAGEVLAAHAGGDGWSDIAVLLPRAGHRARAVVRALTRHGVPSRAPAASALDEPLVRAVVDLLRWADGDGGAADRLLTSPLAGLDPAEVAAARRRARAGGTGVAADPALAPLAAVRDHLVARRAAGDAPADLAYEVWARAVAPLPPPPEGSTSGIDGLVALVDALGAHDEAGPAALGEALTALEEGELEVDPWRARRSAPAEGVTIATLAEAAGREWRTVVVAGCLEGELPRASAGRPPFRPLDPERRRDLLAGERARFAVAATRATARTVAVAAPEPGVLVSRYVEGWARRGPALPLAPGHDPPARRPTASPVAVHPTGRLVLSASQLDTYDDCPLRHHYQYVLRARGDSGVHADLGSLVHDVLAEFCAPGRPPTQRTRQALHELAAARWRDDIARYRPQVEEARRDYFDILERWWAAEGDPGGGECPDVVAVEHRFDIEVGPHRLTGAIDRVDRIDDGGSPALRVVDYKTGKREPPRAEVVDNLQLAVYHLAASRDPALAGHGRVARLRLLFLRSMRPHERVVADTDAELAATEARVMDAAERILAEEAEPSVDANCRYCDFHRLCPLQVRGRQVGAG